MTRQFKKLAHSLYECKYHIVFCPKYRYKILRDEVAKYVERKIHVLCSQKDDIEVIAINVQPDHVHIVVSIPPKYAVSQFMGFLKGKLALDLFDHYLSLEPQCVTNGFMNRESGNTYLANLRDSTLTMIQCPKISG